MWKREKVVKGGFLENNPVSGILLMADADQAEDTEACFANQSCLALLANL